MPSESKASHVLSHASKHHTKGRGRRKERRRVCICAMCAFTYDGSSLHHFISDIL